MLSQVSESRPGAPGRELKPNCFVAEIGMAEAVPCTKAPVDEFFSKLLKSCPDGMQPAAATRVIRTSLGQGHLIGGLTS